MLVHLKKSVLRLTKDIFFFTISSSCNILSSKKKKLPYVLKDIIIQAVKFFFCLHCFVFTVKHVRERERDWVLFCAGCSTALQLESFLWLMKLAIIHCWFLFWDRAEGSGVNCGRFGWIFYSRRHDDDDWIPDWYNVALQVTTVHSCYQCEEQLWFSRFLF